jgi:HK97 family phage prohead protease
VSKYIVGEAGPELFVPAKDVRIVREVTFAVADHDGRTIEARVIPYNTPAKVVDSPANGGTGIPYIERWLPGAFDRQTNAANRVEVWLNIEHEDGFRGVIGHGTALREAPDALYGTFRVAPGPDGDKALHLVNEGVLTGLSVEAIPSASRRSPEGIVERVKARLDKVALCRAGITAFKEAQVLAVREAPEDEPASISGTPILTTEPAPDELTPAPEPEPEGEPVPAMRQFTHEEVQEVAASLERATFVDELLGRVGYEVIKRAVTHKPWDGSAARFTDEQYASSCLIDRGGDAPAKTRCSLPVLEPNGDLNANALGAAAGRLNQLTNVTTAQKAAAARKLRRYYGMVDMSPPPSVMAMAGRA